ncbi:MAG: sigma-70 family RNA polymerase sigma factor [Acidobacteriota bacterium]
MSNLEIGLDYVNNEIAFVNNLRVGSEEAFETLVGLYQSSIYSIAFRVLGDASEAAEVVQDTFMKIHKGIRGFRGECGLKTWIYRIAVSESLNRQRWWRRWRQRATISLDQPPSGDSDRGHKLDVPDSRPGPESCCATKEMEAVVQRALKSVSLEFRIVVVLRDIEGLSYEEIGEALGISLGTVKSRLWRGRVELRKRLEEVLGRPLESAWSG